MEKNKCKVKMIIKNAKGITLLALAVTIVVLLILTSIGLKLALGNNGIIGEAKNAKEQAEIDEEKGIVKRATTVSLIKSKGSKVEQDTLKKALDDETGEGKTEVSDVGDVFEVAFVDSNRYYEVDSEGNISDVNEIIKDNYAGDITKGGKCDGSEKKPYEISCIEDLVAFSNMTNGVKTKLSNGVTLQSTAYNSFEGKYVVLTRSLNFKSKHSYDDYTRTDFGDLNEDGIIEDIKTELTKKDENCMGFASIGQKTAFKGFFRGNNNSIQNIYTKKYGLFRYIENATITDFSVSGEIESIEYAGAIASFATSCTIRNCCSNVDIVAADSQVDYQGTGGLIGTITKTNIYNCYNVGDVIGESQIGGIVGRINGNSKIDNCYNMGSVITNATKPGKVCGGIAGNVQGDNNIIDDCYNDGKIGSDNGSAAGGIVGKISGINQSVFNCYNDGELKSPSRTGGIIGIVITEIKNGNANVNVENCYNKGKIDGLQQVAGGIIGGAEIWQMEGTTYTLKVKNCFNIGKIIGTYKGELVGRVMNATDIELEKCYYILNGNNVIGLKQGTGDYTITDVSGEEIDYIKSNEFVDLLNSNIGNNTDWKKWKLGNDGYPSFEN